MDDPDRDATRATNNLENLLRNVPFFASLDWVSLARLIGALEQIRLPEGVVVVEEGAEPESMYLLESGRVEVSTGSAGGNAGWLGVVPRTLLTNANGVKPAGG